MNSSDNAIIGAGIDNEIVNTDFAGIINGQNNEVTDSTLSIILDELFIIHSSFLMMDIRHTHNIASGAYYEIIMKLL